jgi:ParB family chromosome partitioning protein
VREVRFTAVNRQPDQASAPAAVLGDARPEPPQRTNGIPEPRDADGLEESADRPTLKRFPYNDGLEAAQHLIHKMSDEEFDKMHDVLSEHRAKRSANAG